MWPWLPATHSVALPDPELKSVFFGLLSAKIMCNTKPDLTESSYVRLLEPPFKNPLMVYFPKQSSRNPNVAIK